MQHGTSQMDSIIDEIKQLRKDIGPVEELQDVEGAPAGGLASDVRKLLDEQTARAADTASLQTSIKALAAIVREDIRRNAEVHSGLSKDMRLLSLARPLILSYSFGSNCRHGRSPPKRSGTLAEDCCRRSVRIDQV